MEFRSEMAPVEPAATGERSRTERATMRGAAAPSEREIVNQPPVFLPAGQAAAAELQRDAEFGRVEAGDAGPVGGVIKLRAAPPRIMDQRQAEREGCLVRRHAVDERKRI